MGFRPLCVVPVTLALAGWASAQSPLPTGPKSAALPGWEADAAPRPAPAPAAPAPVPLAPAFPGAGAPGPVPCGVDGCGGDAGGGRVWVDAEYLLWWMRGAHLPPLVTTSPAGTAAAQAGVLGAPGTSVLFGGSSVNEDLRSGVRLGAGAWLDEAGTLGVEASFFALESKATRFLAASDGSTILARPFVDATTGLPASVLAAFPGTSSGTVAASETSDGLIGAGFLFRERFCLGSHDFRLDALVGYRYLRFGDRLDVTQGLTSTGAANPNFVVPGTTLAVSDRFDSHNEFNGVDLGLEASYLRGPLSLRVLGKLAAGINHQTVSIGGNTAVTVPGADTANSVGGLLALPTNIGHHSRDEGALVPELGVKLGYQVTPNVRATVGYTYLYWSDVARAGDLVNTTINPGRIPPSTTTTGPQQPAFFFQKSNLWVQGIDLGLELRF